MQAAMPPYWGAESSTSSLAMRPPGQAIGANIGQKLLLALKKDFKNPRGRFLPRAKLIEIIDDEVVEQLLQRVAGECIKDASHLQKAVQRICLGPKVCSCGCRHCTGGRMILATLFLCGKEDIILSFFPLSKPQICDKSLPLRFHSTDDFSFILSAEERELFDLFQWHVYTPFIAGITSDQRQNVAAFPNEVSLPWMEKERIGEHEEGEVSYVEKIKVHHLNHDLEENNVFALKTFEQRLAPDLAEIRFRREVDANLDVQTHDRIVQLLAAFSQGERFYLIFPLATEGSLKSLWKKYIPHASVDQSASDRVAPWYSDQWLVGECLGTAEALLATHGLLDGNTEDTKGHLHADIKPENILCFSNSYLGKRSIVLKLADFGEAKKVKSDLRANTVAHVMTYRPPEHSASNTITLNYDVWCLGCLFLDFVNWAIFGQGGIDSFSGDRQDESDEAAVTRSPGQIIDDTFFKRAKQEPVPFILNRFQCGRSRDTKFGSEGVTTTYSLWAASHVCITSRVKDAVVSVTSYVFEAA
ncbi:kinase-like domain-containing protein [Diaporthe sp. PMI_573]|nr:kinase-like domain-containing protein [Diaporthaceae sp. PMI_573]